MILSTPITDALSFGDATLAAVLGYSVVFFGLILLMLVVILLGKSFSASVKKAAPIAEAAVEAPPAKTAPGAAGQLKLHNVEPKTAAMLMAIVADKMNKPINELRFISIKEVAE